MAYECFLGNNSDLKDKEVCSKGKLRVCKFHHLTRRSSSPNLSRMNPEMDKTGKQVQTHQGNSFLGHLMQPHTLEEFFFSQKVYFGAGELLYATAFSTFSTGIYFLMRLKCPGYDSDNICSWAAKTSPGGCELPVL